MLRLVLTIFIFCSSTPIYSKCRKETLKNNILEIQCDLAKELTSEFGFVYVGGHAYHHDAAMTLELYSRASLEEARHLVIYIAKRLEEKINTDERIHPYLEKCLSPPYDISVEILFYNPIDSSQCDGSISCVHLVNSKIFYRKDDVFSGYSKFEFKESYEEAKQIIESTRSLKPSLHQNSPLEAAFDVVTSHYTNFVARQLRLDVFNIGCKKNDQLEKVDIRMTRYAKAKEKQARILIVKAVEKLLATVNSNEALSPHQGNTSFTAEQIRMRINFRDNNCCSFDKNSLESVVLEGGKVTYFEKKHSERTPTLSESYSKAKERVL